MSVAIGQCCCTSGTVCCQPSCATDGSLKRDWSFSITGIANSVCTSCTEYNGNFRLKWNDQCQWIDQRSSPPACAFAPTIATSCYWNFSWQLTYTETGSKYVLRLNSLEGLVPEVYERTAAGWNCTSSNTMTLIGTGPTVCASFPTSVVVAPSTSTQPICVCRPPYEANSLGWTFSLTTVGDCCAPELNTAFTLTATTSVNQCRWANQVGTDCPNPPFDIDRTVYMNLQYGFVPGWVVLTFVQAGDRVGAHYRMPCSAFNPVGANVLTTASQNLCQGTLTMTCVSWPTSITLTPA